ncbi:Uncharacterised protein [Raoultella terrigena]|uniref:Uncharacterized protein n=1 Tax=Raoultella terrigena TaxID=577 RepID=A0A4U9D267_RAOTE|nr:Uncharacterised protein [Raoultella terrigena]
MVGYAPCAIVDGGGWEVTGSKTTQDGVEAARMCGIDGYPLRLEPQLVCDTEDSGCINERRCAGDHLPARRTGPGEDFYLQAVQEIVDTALVHHVPRIIFTSSTSVYGNASGTLKEGAPAIRKPPAAGYLKSWRTGCITFREPRSIFYASPGWWGHRAIRDVSLPVSRRRTASRGQSGPSAGRYRRD